MFTLNGRTAVMMGASGYEGAGAVRAMVAGGMNVVMMTHMIDQSNRLIESLGEYKDRCIATTSDDGFEALYQEVSERFGSVDVIIPNQGGPMVWQELADITEEEFTRKLVLQIVRSFQMVQSAIPYLEKSKAGRVILMSSSGARDGLRDEGLCDSTARGGVISMTYSLARELAPKGITVNCIAKGGLPSGHEPQTQNEYDAARLLDRIPVGRTGTPDEYGAAVAYLASEEASFITGQVINVCGGLYMG